MAQVDISHLFVFHIASIVCIDGEGLALSVERVDHVFLVIVETFVREVLRIAVHLLGVNFSRDFTLRVVIYEVIMHELVVVEDLDE